MLREPLPILDSNCKKQMKLPDLHQVDVYTQVPGVAPPQKAEQIEQFWIKYLAVCGATISPQTYSNAWKLSSPLTSTQASHPLA